MRRLWTPAEDKLMMELYPSMDTLKLAKKLNRGSCSIWNRAHTLNLNKTPEYLSKFGKKVQKYGKKFTFKKGNVSWNKGKKLGPDWGGKATRFVKGGLPWNTKGSDGEISIRTHNGIAYKHIRVAVGKWVHLHKYNWEQVNGKVPAGHIVIFKTNDRTNCDVSNLMLISRGDHAQRNKFIRYPEELVMAIKTLATLKKTIHGKNNSRPTGNAV
jgi:hypothetical protein